MSKLRGAKKVEFLRRMARGRAKARRGSGAAKGRRTTTKRRAVRARRGTYSGSIYKSRKHPGVVRFRVRRNPLQALIANPSREYEERLTSLLARGWSVTDAKKHAGNYARWVGKGKKRRRSQPRAARRVRRFNPESTALVPYGFDFAPKRRVKKRRSKKGASSMAKRRRRSGKRRVRRASPRRRTYRRRPVHRRRSRRALRAIGHVTGGRRRTIYVNPSRKRRHRRIARRRNPGFGGLLRMAFVPYATGIVTSAATAMLDSGLAQWPMVTHLVKVGGALGIAAFFGRKHPMAASAAIGALGASQGYPLVTKLAGGMFAHTPAQAVKGLGEMSDTYPEMGALLSGGLGALLSGPTDVPVTTLNYQQALMNMGDDDDDS